MRHASRSCVLGRTDMPAYLSGLRPWLAARAARHPPWPLSGQALSAARTCATYAASLGTCRGPFSLDQAWCWPRDTEAVERVLCLGYGARYEKPLSGGMLRENRGCPRCGYVGGWTPSPRPRRGARRRCDGG